MIFLFIFTFLSFFASCDEVNIDNPNLSNTTTNADHKTNEEKIIEEYMNQKSLNTNTNRISEVNLVNDYKNALKLFINGLKNIIEDKIRNIDQLKSEINTKHIKLSKRIQYSYNFYTKEYTNGKEATNVKILRSLNNILEGRILTLRNNMIDFFVEITQLKCHLQKYIDDKKYISLFQFQGLKNLLDSYELKFKESINLAYSKEFDELIKITIRMDTIIKNLE